MDIKMFFLILTSVSLSAVAQILLKYGMSSGPVQEMLETGRNYGDVLYIIFGNGHVILGLVTYGIGALLWLFVLARIDVTLAYPFVGLGFILIMFFGFAILGEQLGTARIAGTLLITTGVVLLANS